MTEQTPILSVQGLCAGYRGHTVLRDISFTLAPGEILCVAGESGCGKSTLLRALMGADDAAGRYDARRFAADAEEALGRLGLTDPCRLLACRPYELSGGMNQRMAMALALLLGQQVLLADEPTSALDAVLRLQMARELKELSRSGGMAQVVVTHDLALAQFLADTLAVLHEGRFVEYGPADAVLRAPGPYTRRLLEAVPRLKGGSL